MTEEEFYTELQTLEVPVAYDHAPAGTKVPFITYTWVPVPLVFADDVVYLTKAEVQVDLVASSKTEINALGSSLESLLSSLKLGWSASESFSSTEKIYLRFYNLEV